MGQRYGDKLCHVVLGDVTDAYEWSFVAVPAQREAGVTKQFRSETDGAQRCKQLEQQLQNRDVLLNRMQNALRQDVVRLRVSGRGLHGKGCCFGGSGAHESGRTAGIPGDAPHPTETSLSGTAKAAGCTGTERGVSDDVTGEYFPQ